MTFKLIQLGLGARGIGGWFIPIQESKEWEPAAYVDANEERLNFVAKNYSVPRDLCFLSLEEAIKNVRADAVLIVGPTSIHAPMALTALKADLHVLVEKPFTNTMESAKEVVREADERGLIIMVGQNFRFYRTARTIRKLIREKFVGELGAVIFNSFAWFEHYRHGWRQDETDDVYVINQAIHYFDDARNMTGLDAVECISATSWKPKWSTGRGYMSITTVFKMENDVIAIFTGSCDSKGKPATTWRFECSNGTIEAEGRGLIEGKPLRGLIEEKVMVSFKDIGMLEVDLIPMEMEGERYLLHEFYDCILRKKEPETSGRDNLKSQAMVHAAIESFHTGKPVKVQREFI